MSWSTVPSILVQAEEESRKARCFYVGVEHLFLAIARYGGPRVEHALQRHRVELADAVRRVRHLLCAWNPGENWNGLLRQTPRVRQVSQRATCLAERDGGKPPEADHFLAAILEETRCQTTRAILGKVGAPRSRPPTSASPAKERSDDEAQLKFEPAGEEDPSQAGASGKRLVLEHFGRDLTALAQQKKLPPHVGREAELQTIIRTLSRQTKPNPLLVGDPGTGKTALVEGLAQRIAEGNIPANLKNLRIIELSLGSLVAGTQYRGEFEKRLELILDELREHPEIVMFLDEFHQAVGAGAGGGGAMDAANLLKPALARGEFKCIAASTLREYRKHLEPDAALVRRFQPIIINPPDDNATADILRGLRPSLEKHHNVKIDDAALTAAVELASRYESDRQQPDKSIDLLDDACARVAVLTGDAAAGNDAGELRVQAEHVARAVSERTGIPVANLSLDERHRLVELEATLSRSIHGQREAVAAVAAALREIRLGLRDDNRPQAVFLFAGPTGVGKTALAELLAKEYFGQRESLLRLDMSEYMDEHSVSRLIGSPPGYVGHGEGGQLTRELRTRPFRLVLLDEIEKADQQICDVFLQVFGSGRLTDGSGNIIDCRPAIFVMTSNLGAEAYSEDAGFGFRPASRDAGQETVERNAAVLAACRKHFRPEFLNRIDRIVCFNALGSSAMRSILDGLLAEMIGNLATRGVELEVPDEARGELVEAAGLEQGVPPLKRLLRERILNEVARLMVDAAANQILRVRLRPGNAGMELLTDSN